MSVDLKKVKCGDYVVVSSVFHDYGKVGNVFRIIDSNIPGEPTAAVGYLIDLTSGLVTPPYSYKLPCDKVDLMSRKDLAALLRKTLKMKKKLVDQAEQEYSLLYKRIVNLESYYSHDRECEEMLGEMFSFMR